MAATAARSRVRYYKFWALWFLVGYHKKLMPVAYKHMKVIPRQRAK